ncbi:glucosamine--fructose-6-phosphate aminotransferase (isomerizing) [Rhodoferax ferrireducens]|uniref:Glucosamine--fructose-6-phosphate aminotransferase (Isomerizing) n=1 Tax=Rhodoferax ferrireducens TaxID=192843 RepID=A0ABU2C9D9_9BURK|nr:SIS domain-containing protein [Rhodoferax ferrireducens]MDR7377960.1 glucosamine--fructose-6-phosphate aminotransferase (isomerizing) [Rhodoferax ferrireducens]
MNSSTPTHMYAEAVSSAQQVQLQLAADADRYAALGAALRARPPSGTVTIARGSSDHAAAYMAYLIMARNGQLVTSLPMSLLTLYQAPLAIGQMLAISISQSGRSPDLVEPMQLFQRAGATTVALVNDTASPLAAAVDWAMPLHAGPELSVAATKSFICGLVAGARLAACWSDTPDFIARMADLPAALEQACQQDWSAAIAALLKAERLMVIGRGPGLAIANEAALKFKETCGIQAEAFSAAEVKHGPMALVSDAYPMLVFAPRGPAQASLVTLAAEMRERGARVLLAAPADVSSRDLTLATAPHEDLDPITAIQSFYLLVEAVARARGQDPDRPRHLSKVTSTR